MKMLLLVLFVSALVTASAQTGSQTAYQGQSWTGLLVSSSCQKPDLGKRMKSDRESDLTTNGRTTTPPVDGSGTRGSSEADGVPPSQKQNLPETGDVLEKGKSIDPGWAPAHKQALGLGASCTVDANTTKFALLLPDGKMLQFDDLASEAVAKQLPSFPVGARSRKVLRVLVQGKIQNGQIALDSIRM